MAIEFEPVKWWSKDRRFVILFANDCYETNDYTGGWESYHHTFADAVAWCESRAKQQQGQGEARP